MKARLALPLLLLLAFVTTGCGIKEAVGIRNDFSADLVSDQTLDAQEQFAEDKEDLTWKLHTRLHRSNQNKLKREQAIETEYQTALAAAGDDVDAAIAATNAYRDRLANSAALWESNAQQDIGWGVRRAREVFKRYDGRLARASGIAAVDEAANEEAKSAVDFISGIRSLDEYSELVEILKAVADRFGIELPDDADDPTPDTITAAEV